MSLLIEDKKALLHLKKDVVLKSLIKITSVSHVRVDADLYRALLRSVVGQQLSVKAAASIFNKFCTAFPKQYPDKNLVLEMSDERLRACGLSLQKSKYIRNIASFFIEHANEIKSLQNKSDEEIISFLTQIKGVGKWTVEMLLMFSLDRPDVFPIDDLGIVNGMQALYGVKISDKKKQKAKLNAIAENWRPYRTLACFYVWRYKDNLPIPSKKRAAKKSGSIKNK